MMTLTEFGEMSTRLMVSIENSTKMSTLNPVAKRRIKNQFKFMKEDIDKSKEERN